MATGTIAQIIGAVVDVEFDSQSMPGIYNALTVESGAGEQVVMEVQQHVGNNWVRCISMRPTEGLRRGLQVEDTGGPISVPVGPDTLGRVFDVVGEPIDEQGPCNAENHYPIHRPAPKVADQATSTEMFATGLKVIDLDCPVHPRRQDRDLRRRRRRQDGHDHGADQ